MQASGRIRVAFPDSRSAGDALRALEGEQEKGRRFESRVFLEKNELVVEAEGDLVALRAALNAYFRYLQAIEGIEGVEHGKKRH